MIYAKLRKRGNLDKACLWPTETCFFFLSKETSNTAQSGELGSGAQKSTFYQTQTKPAFVLKMDFLAFFPPPFFFFHSPFSFFFVIIFLRWERLIPTLYVRPILSHPSRTQIRKQIKPLLAGPRGTTRWTRSIMNLEWNHCRWKSLLMDFFLP